MDKLNLKERSKAATREIQNILHHNESDYPKEVAEAIERAITDALIAERKYASEIARNFGGQPTEKTERIANEIRTIRSVVSANLSSLR